MRIKKTIVIKPTLECNLRCGYCYEHGRFDRRLLSTGRLAADDIVSIVRRVSNLFPGAEVLWLFHGGEPLLWGEDAFRLVFREIRRINRETSCRFFVAIQTNATLFSEKLISLFHEYSDLLSERQVSVSIDGPDVINDVARFAMAEGFKSVSQRVVDVIRQLRLGGIDVNTITVVGKHNVQNVEELFNFFTEIAPLHQKFIPCYNFSESGGFDKFAVTPSEFSDFLCKLFDLWIENPKYPTGEWKFIDPLTALMGNIAGAGCISRWCEFCEEKCDNFITIFPNGDLRICESYTEEYYRNIVHLGNIYKIDDKEFVSCLIAPWRFSEFKSFERELMFECQGCRIFRVCKGGCLHYRDKFKSLAGMLGNEYCRGKIAVVDYLSKKMKEYLRR